MCAISLTAGAHHKRADVADELLLRLEATLYDFREFVADVKVALHDTLETRVADTAGLESRKPSPSSIQQYHGKPILNEKQREAFRRSALEEVQENDFLLLPSS